MAKSPVTARWTHYPTLAPVWSAAACPERGEGLDAALPLQPRLPASPPSFPRLDLFYRLINDPHLINDLAARRSLVIRSSLCPSTLSSRARRGGRDLLWGSGFSWGSELQLRHYSRCKKRALAP